MTSHRLTTCTCIVGGFLSAVGMTACQRAGAQVVTRDSLAPVRCFEIVTAKQLSDQSAVELCAGTPTDAPGACYALGIDTLPSLSSQQIQQLCARATSVQPIECFAHVDAMGTLTDQQGIDYCATICALGPPPPQASSPECLTEAQQRTDLSLQHSGELCEASTSAGPVACYLAADNLQTLAESSIISLCAETLHCQYYNTTPSPY